LQGVRVTYGRGKDNGPQYQNNVGKNLGKKCLPIPSSQSRRWGKQQYAPTRGHR